MESADPQMQAGGRASSPTGLARIAILAAGVLLIGWQVAVAAVGEALLDAGRLTQSVAADRLSAMAWSTDAAGRLAALDPAGAAHAAREALRRNPIDQRALTVLAFADPKADTSALMSLSATLGWHYPIAQIWLARAGMAIGDGSLAATRLDALARKLETPTIAWPLIDEAIAAPALRAAMVDRIAARPSWRAPYLGHVVATAPGIATRTALLADLARGAAPATPPELLPYVRVLERNGHAADGYAIWANFVATPTAWSGLLYDGAFRHTADAGSAFSFAWGLAETEGGSATTDDAGGVLLQSDGSAAAPLLVQTRMLPAGRYRLTATAAVEDGAPDQPPPFAWFVRCDGNDVMAAAGSAARAVRAGQAGYDFAVPGGCRFQTISVDAVPGMPGASSTVRLRTARIDRIG